MDFQTLFGARTWTPICNCPGRFGLAEGPVADSPESLAPGADVREYRVQSAKDVVVVASFPSGGGLISYKRRDGRYVHTLNTPQGFMRKLAQLEIASVR
jgi:hypothetical protein